MSPVKTQSLSEVSRITGDLSSRGKTSSHWSFDYNESANSLTMAVRSDDGMFNAQQNLSKQEVAELRLWLEQVEEKL